MFIGQGIDRHKLIKTSKPQILKIGGVGLKGNYQAEAVSDGDVVLHALANALLGAIQMGDIGQYFNDHDFANQNLDSRRIVQFACEQIRQKRLTINNIDLTIICQNIMFASYREEIQNSIMGITGCYFVNVKATRYEEPNDFIECHCSVLLR